MEKAAIENSTAVFTKRVYRDAWNRNIVKRIAKTRNHTLKIKARIRAKVAMHTVGCSCGVLSVSVCCALRL